LLFVLRSQQKINLRETQTKLNLVVDINKQQAATRVYMKNNRVRYRNVALATLVTLVIVAISALAMHAPSSKPNLLGHAFKSIQTDRVILFDGSAAPVIASAHVTVQGPPITGESRDATEHLKKAAEPFLIAQSHVTVQGPPITGESRDATEHLKLVAQAF
jgi:hypothetical protein